MLKKTLVASLLAAGLTGNLFAFDAGVYTCATPFGKAKANLKSNGRYVYEFSSMGYGLEYRGTWTDDDDAAIFIVEEKQGNKTVEKTVVIKESQGRYVMSDAFECEKQGANKEKATSSAKTTAKKVNRDYLISLPKKENLRIVGEWLENPNVEGYTDVVFQYMAMDGEFYIFQKLTTAPHDGKTSKEEFQKTISEFNVPDRKLIDSCNYYATQLQQAAGEKGVKILYTDALKATQECGARAIKSFKNMANIENYVAFRSGGSAEQAQKSQAKEPKQKAEKKAKPESIANLSELTKSCSSCHGAKGEKKALGKSNIINKLSENDFISRVKGYQDGTYGGAMKSLMKAQVQKLNDAEINALAQFYTK